MYNFFFNLDSILSKGHIKLINSQPVDDIWFCKDMKYIVYRLVSVYAEKHV